MDLCNLLCVSFCDLLLHHASLKAEITETLACLPSGPVCSSSHTHKVHRSAQGAHTLDG